MPTSSPRTFRDVLSAAIDDLTEHGFDSAARVERWTVELRAAADRSMASAAEIDLMMRDAFAAIYKRMIDNGGVLKTNPGVARFTLDRVRPELRGELDRRIMAAANLIKLNRTEAIEQTIRRFQGWSTSIPPGGSGAAKKAKRQTKREIRKAIAGLPFAERRVLIDQGAKLVASINQVVAEGGGAIAGRWRSNYRQIGYRARPDHKERDGKYFLIKGSWAHEAGLVKKGPDGYTNDITKPGEEVFCRCLPGSTRIPFADVEKVSRRWYDGPAVTITTITGREITATLNHPILSQHGWRAAGLFEPGDDLVEVDPEQLEIFAERDDNDRIPTIAEVFSSLIELGPVQLAAGTRQDFHGDGITDRDVDIVTPARPLLIDYVSIGMHGDSQLCFPSADPSRSSVSPFSQKRFSFLGIGEQLASSLSSSFEQVWRTLRFLLHPEILSLRYASQGHASCNQASLNSYRMNTELAGDGLDPDAVGVLFDDRRNIQLKSSTVIKVERHLMNCHVYNFQTSAGAYLANGIVTHNCSYRYIYNLRDLPKDMLTEKGKAALESARAQAEHYPSHRADATDKKSKADVGYLGPFMDHPENRRCDECTMFRRPFSCTAVAGDIDPGGWCRLFEVAARLSA